MNKKIGTIILIAGLITMSGCGQVSKSNTYQTTGLDKEALKNIATNLAITKAKINSSSINSSSLYANSYQTNEASVIEPDSEGYFSFEMTEKNMLTGVTESMKMKVRYLNKTTNQYCTNLVEYYTNPNNYKMETIQNLESDTYSGILSSVTDSNYSYSYSGTTFSMSLISQTNANGVMTYKNPLATFNFKDVLIKINLSSSGSDPNQASVKFAGEIKIPFSLAYSGKTYTGTLETNFNITQTMSQTSQDGSSKISEALARALTTDIYCEDNKIGTITINADNTFTIKDNEGKAIN